MCLLKLMNKYYEQYLRIKFVKDGINKIIIELINK